MRSMHHGLIVVSLLAFVSACPEGVGPVLADGGLPANVSVAYPENDASVNKDCETLYDAVHPERDIKVLEQALKNCSDPNVTRGEKFRDTPLYRALPDLEKVRILLEHGADPNIAGYDRHTPLEKVLREYLHREITIPSYHAGQTPRVYDKVSLVRLLVDHGADINARNHDWGVTGALRYTRREDKEIIDLLITHGATLAYVFDAARYRHIGPMMEDSLSLTNAGPITIAVDLLEREDLALALLRRNRKIDPYDRFALLHAARRGWHDVTQGLLLAGADPNVSDNQGITPLAQAERRRDAHLIKILVAAGANPPPKPVGIYMLNSGGEFEKAVAIDLDQVAFFDPPRYSLSLRGSAKFVFYGEMSSSGRQSFESISCDRSTSFEIIKGANSAGMISVGVCNKETPRVRKLAASAKKRMKVLLDNFVRGGMNIRAGPTNLNNPLSGFPAQSGHDTPRQHGEPHEQTFPS